MDAASVIAKTMEAAKRPLTEDQQILLAGAVAVCIEKALANERERCAAVVRYWLAGHAPSEGSYEARCIAHLLDGRPASAWAERA